MNEQITSVPSNTNLRLQIKDSVIHHFNNKTKQKLAQGTCRIYETDITDIETPSKQKGYILKVKNFNHQINASQILVRINYPQNTTYLFQKQNFTICSVSFNKNNGVEKFQNIFGSFSTIMDFNSTNVSDKLREKINEHCPANIQTKDISQDFKSKVKKLGKVIGIIAGKAENVVTKPAQSAASSLSQRASQISRQSISQANHNRWNTIKEKSSQLNEKLTYFMTPVVNTYRNIQDYVGQTFKSSQNKIIKTVREYSEAFASSINQGETSTHSQQNNVALKETGQVSSLQLK